LNYKQDGVLDKDRMMDNVQKQNICGNVPSSQTFSSYLQLFFPHKAHPRPRAKNEHDALQED
jgi:hypothetical protein